MDRLTGRLREGGDGDQTQGEGGGMDRLTGRLRGGSDRDKREREREFLYTR